MKLKDYPEKLVRILSIAVLEEKFNDDKSNKSMVLRNVIEKFLESLDKESKDKFADIVKELIDEIIEFGKNKREEGDDKNDNFFGLGFDTNL